MRLPLRAREHLRRRLVSLLPLLLGVSVGARAHVLGRGERRRPLLGRVRLDLGRLGPGPLEHLGSLLLGRLARCREDRRDVPAELGEPLLAGLDRLDLLGAGLLLLVEPSPHVSSSFRSLGAHAG